MYQNTFLNPLRICYPFYCCSVAKSRLTLCNPKAHQAPLSFPISRSLLKLISIEPVILTNHLILCHPLLLLSSIFPSISLFQWVGSWHQVAKVLELQHESFQEIHIGWLPLGFPLIYSKSFKNFLCFNWDTIYSLDNQCKNHHFYLI